MYKGEGWQVKDIERLAWTVALVLFTLYAKHVGYVDGQQDERRAMISEFRKYGLVGPEFHPEIK